MKKIMMVLVCLMTMLNINAQNDDLYEINCRGVSMLEGLASRNYDSKKANDYGGTWHSIDETAMVKISDSSISITKLGETFVIKCVKDKWTKTYKYYTEVKIPVYGIKKITLYVNFRRLTDGLATLNIQSIQSDATIYHTYKLIKEGYSFSKQ